VPHPLRGENTMKTTSRYATVLRNVALIMLVTSAILSVITCGGGGSSNADTSALEARIAALEAKLAGVTRESVNGQPTLRFSGINVQVVNGAGSTDTANGTGNLIVGYDEADSSGDSRCTLGTAANGTPLNAGNCVANGATLSTTGFKTGSHYLVVGPEHNYSRWGGIVAGIRNTSNFDYASVSGGNGNTAGGEAASVSGGNLNTASGINASVSGGHDNAANSESASVSGGAFNAASGSSASVSGGQINAASGSSASVSGGAANTASGDFATVSGGSQRSAIGGWDWRGGSLFEDQ
jgi:hypothetical protein